MGEGEFGLELLKLLLEMACADGRVHRVESEIVLGLARSWSVPPAQVDALSHALRRGVGLPAPNLALLRTRPQRVLEAIHLLALSDGALASDEQALVREAEVLLGTKLAPEPT